MLPNDGPCFRARVDPWKSSGSLFSSRKASQHHITMVQMLNLTGGRKSYMFIVDWKGLSVNMFLDKSFTSL